jgi:DNA-binding MarR family transcriptional regulator
MSTDKNVLIDLWLLSFLASRMVSEILDDIPLSVDEFAMYGLISDLAPITSADLVRATGLSPTTVSSLVRRCEARGELKRTDNPEDARSSLLQLTPAGYEVLGRAVPRLLDGLERIERGLRGRHRQIREALRDLDQVIRNELGVGPRPYELDGPTVEESALAYTGEPLTPQQVDEARQFVDWIRARDS